MNAGCDRCGVTAADLPIEDLDLDLDEASDVLFVTTADGTLCRGCADVS